MTSHRADQKPADTAARPDRSVRLAGGVFAVLILSVVAAILTVLDRADRARIERSIVEAGPRSSPKPWSDAMAARTIDGPRIRRPLARAEGTAA